MKKNIIITLFSVIFTLFISSAAFSQMEKSCCDKKDDKGCVSESKSKSDCTTDKKVDNKAKTNSLKNKSSENKNSSSWNSVCPVSGEDVNLSARTVNYGGKEIAFCCDGCATKFEKDPSKYMKNLSPDGKSFIKTN